MRKGFRIPLIAVAAALCACANTKQFAAPGFRPPASPYKLVVMQPDISLGVLTVGGGIEPRADWTSKAQENVFAVLVAQQAARGGNAHIATSLEKAGPNPAEVADLVRLHSAVGDSIRAHKYLGAKLPTKTNRFDWTLGEQAVAYGAATQYDYALFLHANQTFSSGGRVAMRVAATAACLAGFCNIPEGGQLTGFASLVDLRTGNVVWFNVLSSSDEDIRTRTGAERLVSSLVGDMKARGSPQGVRRTQTTSRSR